MTISGPETRFIETKEYQRFKEFCDACRKYKYIGLCYGAAGVGKTLSARHYANWDVVSRFKGYIPWDDVGLEIGWGHYSVVFYTVPAAFTSPNRLLREIQEWRELLRSSFVEQVRKYEAPGVQARRNTVDTLETLRRQGDDDNASPDKTQQARDAWFSTYTLFTRRMAARPDPTSLILIDEADRLKVNGLEQMRAIFDEGGIGMVLIGMPGLEKRLARYPQLYSRIGFVHEYKSLSQTDVRELIRELWNPPPELHLSADALNDEPAIATIIREARGNFRSLDRLLAQIGRVLEINRLDKVTPPVVEAARESLVIGTA